MGYLCKNRTPFRKIVKNPDESTGLLACSYVPSLSREYNDSISEGLFTKRATTFVPALMHRASNTDEQYSVSFPALEIAEESSSKVNAGQSALGQTNCELDISSKEDIGDQLVRVLKPAPKKLAVPAKNGTVGYPVKKGKEPSRSYSDSEDDKVPKTKVTALSKKMPATAAKNGALSHPKKENDSSDSSDSDAESDEEDDVMISDFML
ncbi:hypothetical protein CJ030_MR7G008216 [Morella rubra]|uniref:Uncharacterized protein n=1 Tax=Morella rubra TaxID=262757 RepID=A0A6A1V4M5_9ROSI|nr:hypothetical protein CJ030_MR7G008216 [Morella rubra]